MDQINQNKIISIKNKKSTTCTNLDVTNAVLKHKCLTLTDYIYEGKDGILMNYYKEKNGRMNSFIMFLPENSLQ